MRRRTWRLLIALPLALVLTFGAAWAYWSAGSVPGGSGAAAATTVGPGMTPTAVVANGVVSVSWGPSTLTSGQAVDGYLVRRYDAATQAPQPVNAGCAGIVTATSCIETSLPSGLWVYTVTPVLGTNWRGAESPPSNAVTTDTTPPVNAITTSVVSGNAAQTGDTVFYRGVAAGSFTLRNAVSDSGSGPASSQTSALAGGSTGWSHTPSSVSTPSGGPYVSNPFSWTAGTTSAPTDTVTGRDVGGNVAVTTLTFVNDSTSPTGTTVSYPNGYQPDPSVVITSDAGTDTGSGISTRQLERASASLTAGTCGTFTGFVAVGPDGPPSPYTDSQVSNGTCYQYRYVVTDRVGNQRVATSPNVAKIDGSFGGPALRSAASYSVLAGTGVANTGPTTVSGDLGVSPSTSITGFPPGIVAGTVHAGDAAAAQAQADLVLAYTNAAGRTPTTNFSGDQIGKTFFAGVHHTAAAFALTGTMTLDGQGDPNAVFVFQIDAAMNTGALSSMTLINGAKASNVYWQVNGAVGTGGLSSLPGTIMAADAITLGAGSQLIGRALSYGTVTMAANTVRFTSALPPTVTIDGGASATTKDTTPTITGTTNAPVGTSVTVKVAAQVLLTTVQTGGTWGVTAAALSAASYNIVASVRDAAGNNGAASQTLLVEVNPDPVVLGSAAPFSVLAGTGVANTGATTVAGDLGLSPSGAVTGFPPGIVAGDIHVSDAAAAVGQSSLVTAYDNVNARTPHRTIVGNLGGQTFRAGIYHTAVALALTGTVTLDAEGDPSAIFIFQGDAAMNTAAASNVNLVNGAVASNVYWQVHGAVGTGGLSSMSGTIMAAGAITLGAGSQVIGRALSYGTVTMAANTVRFTTAPPPTISITGGAGVTTKDTTPTIAGFSNAPVGTPVTARVSGQVLLATVQAGGSWSATATALTAGTHDVVASVRDASGNAAKASQLLTVEINPAPVPLGSASTYSLLARTGAYNLGLVPSHLDGNLGVSPSNVVVGFPASSVGDTIHAGDAAAAQAQADLTTAYNNADARTPSSEFAGDLIGRTFRAGVHHTAAAMALTGTMTLDAEGDPDAVFIFQVDAAMNTAAASSVALINGAKASNVYWQVNGAAGTGALSSVSGTIMATGGITLGAGAQLHGRALSYGTVTLTANNVTNN